MEFFHNFTNLDFSSLIPVIISIVITEALLSVDNVLVIVALARELPQKQQVRARFFGVVVFGMGFRVLALALASYIMKYKILLYLGAGYLVYLAFSHLFLSKEEEKERKAHTSLWKVVFSIGLADLAFSMDNVVVAVGLSPDIRLVWLGVCAGILTMFFASHLAAAIVERYPKLESAAFVIVGIIGILMLVEHGLGFHLNEISKFGIIILIILSTIGHEEYTRRKKKEWF